MKTTKKFKIENYEREAKAAMMLQWALDKIVNDEASEPIRIKLPNKEEYIFRFWEMSSGFEYFTCTFRYKPTGQKDSTTVYCLNDLEALATFQIQTDWHTAVRDAAYFWRTNLRKTA